MRSWFRPDSGLMIVMAQITDCIFLSLFFLLGCMPVVTVGGSFAALYDAVYRGFRRGEKHTWMRFWETFRENWKSGILPAILVGAAFFGLCWGLIQVWNGAVYGKISWAVFAGAALVGIVLLGALSLVFPMLSRFQNSLGALMKNSFVLALANLPRTMALGIVNAIAILLCVLYVIPVFLLPALAALIGTLLIEPIFRPYMPEEPEEEAAE